jgi:SOS-response transcriptional repressor LexA
MQNCEEDAAYIIKAFKACREKDAHQYTKIWDTVIGFMYQIEDHWQVGKWPPECEQYCEQLQGLAESPDMQNASEIDTRYMQGIAQMYRGTMLLSQGRLEGAIECFSNSQRFFHATSMLRGEAVALLALGIVCQRQCGLGTVDSKKHHWAEALKTLQRSLVIFQNLEDDEFEIDVADRLAEVRESFQKYIETGQISLCSEKPTGHEPSGWPTLQFLPIISKTAAGKPSPTPDSVTGYIATDVFRVGDQYLTIQLLKGSELKFQPEYRYFATHVSGDSMVDADIAPNDYVILKRPLFSEPSPENMDIVAAVIADVDGDEEGAMLKRFLGQDNRITLRPESPNSDHQAHEFSLQEFNRRVRIAGVAVAVLKPRPS